VTRGQPVRRRSPSAGALALGACLAIACCGAGATTPAPQQAIVEMPAVQVKPRPEGPVLWEARKDGRVLWILAVPDALPAGLEWNWANIDARLRQSGALLGEPHISTSFEVGIFRMFGVYRKARAARRNPDDRSLREVLPPDDYARWAPLAARYLGDEVHDVETLRPYFAAQALQGAQGSRLGWTSSLPVWRHLGDIARGSHIPVVLPRHEIRITDPAKVIADFSATALQDLACFRAGLGRVEQFPHDELLQATAWAEGDIAGMEASASEEKWRQDCDSLLSSSFADHDLGQGSALDGKREAWLRAVHEALSAHGTAFAVLPIDLALGNDGYVSTLAGEGYGISAQ
jgi:hypothetical protein